MSTQHADECTHFERPALRVQDLLSEAARALGLRLIAGKKGLARPIETSRIRRLSPSPSTAEPSVARGSVQLLTKKELDALEALRADERNAVLERLRKLPIAAIVVAGDLNAPPYLRVAARANRFPLLSTPLRAALAARRIGGFVAQRIAGRQVVHGVLMDIYGLGTLIVGESGIGKSESALELIERGHRLVSDDVIEVYTAGGNESRRMIMGRSPKLTRHFMELRGLGIVNVRDLFGPSSIRASKSIDLVIRLERWEKATEIERLGLEQETYPMLEASLPLVRMPVGPGRNLAMLIEVAARNYLLKRAGRHAARRLLKRMSSVARRPPRRSQ